MWRVGRFLSHLVLNSSKVSSWCSDRRRDEVLKLGRAAAATRGRARRVVAWKREVAGPRAAMRRRDIFCPSRERNMWCSCKRRKKRKREMGG